MVRPISGCLPTFGLDTLPVRAHFRRGSSSSLGPFLVGGATVSQCLFFVRAHLQSRPIMLGPILGWGPLLVRAHLQSGPDLVTMWLLLRYLKKVRSSFCVGSRPTQQAVCFFFKKVCYKIKPSADIHNSTYGYCTVMNISNKHFLNLSEPYIEQTYSFLIWF